MKLIVLCLIYVVSFSSLGSEYLSDVQLYNRCHTLLTGKRPSFREDNIKKIKEKKISPIEACLEILDSAQLDSHGYVGQRNSQKAIDVINRMNEMHFAGFSEKGNFKGLFGDGRNFYDATEPALHFTKALLSPKGKVSDVLRVSRTLKALRQRDPNWNPRQGPIFGDRNRPDLHIDRYRQLRDSNGVPTPWPQGKFIDRGVLMGVGNMSPLRINSEANGAPGTRGTSIEGLNLRGIDIYRNFGGGILGSPSFLLMTTRIDDGKYGFDGANLPRVWAKSIYKDLLCKTLPAVRTEDALDYVSLTSPLTYRNDVTCTQCHTSIDPLGGSLRNLAYVWNTRSNKTGSITLRRFEIPVKYSVKHPAIKWPDRADKNFHRRPASGRVRFRDYKGDLISQSVTTLSDLGNKLSNMDDFYICAAKKYYKHFMNIDVDVGDPESISVLPSSVDTYHRNKVILMGLKLKKTQSLRSLLQDIISSDDFRKTDFGMKMYEKAK